MVVPDRGDLVRITVEPRQGTRERRLALVVSPALYNSRSGLAIMCAVSRRRKGYPFEVPLPGTLAETGVVQADQLRSTDWRARHAELVCRVPPAVVSEVLRKLKPL